jgi:hypothetical protein
MYERFKLCERLTAKEICFVVERYQQAKFVPEHNEHILRGKVAEEAKFGVLRCFVSHFGDLRPDTMSFDPKRKRENRFSCVLHSERVFRTGRSAILLRVGYRRLVR